MLYIKNRELEWNSDFFCLPDSRKCLVQSLSSCVYMCVYGHVCLHQKPLLTVCRFLLGPAWVLIQFVCWACVCVYVRLAPLVLSLIPVSGKHQPFKTQMAGFFFPPLPSLSSSHQIWGTAGAAMPMICLLLPVLLTGWEHAHTIRRAHTHIQLNMLSVSQTDRHKHT